MTCKQFPPKLLILNNRESRAARRLPSLRTTHQSAKTVRCTTPCLPWTSLILAPLLPYDGDTDEGQLPPLDARLGNPHDLARRQPRGASVRVGQRVRQRLALDRRNGSSARRGRQAGNV